MKMNQENMRRFDVMMKDFAANNNLKVTITHDFDKRNTQGEFRMNDIPHSPRHGYVVLWDAAKSLTEACTAIFTHVTLEFKLTDAIIDVGGLPEIKNVVFNDPATIILWDDGTKTVVKCQEDDIYSKETGLALCIAKKALGNKGNFNEVFKKWIPEEEEPVSTTVNPLNISNVFDLGKIDNIVSETAERIIDRLKKEGRL